MAFSFFHVLLSSLEEGVDALVLVGDAGGVGFGLGDASTMVAEPDDALSVATGVMRPATTAQETGADESVTCMRWLDGDVP